MGAVAMAEPRRCTLTAQEVAERCGWKPGEVHSVGSFYPGGGVEIDLPGVGWVCVVEVGYHRATNRFHFGYYDDWSYYDRGKNYVGNDNRAWLPDFVFDQFPF